VLVWDLGYPFADDPGEYAFGNYGRIEDIYEEIDVAVDYVTGQVSAPRNFYQLNPTYDPYVYAAEQGFWTGNILDYRLIFWNPALGGPGSALAGTCVTDDTTRHALWGGEPDWWSTVVDGLWEGRLVWITSANATPGIVGLPGTEATGFATNSFINTLSATHGMIIDTDAEYGGIDPFPPDLVANAAGIDLTQGFSVIRPLTFTTQISGGETVLTNGETWNRLRSSPAWCNPNPSGETGVNSPWPIAQRNRVALPLTGGGVPERTVDFVITQTRIAFDEGDILWNRFTPEQQAGLIQYMRNLYETPIQGT
jgi:hypothetical protein